MRGFPLVLVKGGSIVTRLGGNAGKCPVHVCIDNCDSFDANGQASFASLPSRPRLAQQILRVAPSQAGRLRPPLLHTVPAVLLEAVSPPLYFCDADWRRRAASEVALALEHDRHHKGVDALQRLRDVREVGLGDPDVLVRLSRGQRTAL